MKVKKIVVFCLIIILLIGGGIWLGIVLTKNNNQPVMAINIVLNDEYKKNFDIVLLVNQKNKIISSNIFENNYDSKLSNLKFAYGKSVRDFTKTTAEYFSKIENNYYDILIDFYGINHDQIFQSKNNMFDNFNDIFEKNSKKYEKNCNFFTNNANLQKKYEKLNQKFMDEKIDFENKTEKEILNIFNLNFKKNT